LTANQTWRAGNGGRVRRRTRSISSLRALYLKLHIFSFKFALYSKTIVTSRKTPKYIAHSLPSRRHVVQTIMNACTADRTLNSLTLPLRHKKLIKYITKFSLHSGPLAVRKASLARPLWSEALQLLSSSNYQQSFHPHHHAPVP
jgi:hypothetical protein